ncbi:MAG: class I SAM-dependent methyltransferase [bacterium]
MKDIVIHNYSDSINFEELNYREKIQPTEKSFANIDNWIKAITPKLKTIPALLKVTEIKGTILELGAGSCWFSGELSKLETVNEIYCLDISPYVLENVAPPLMSHLEAKVDKINRIVGDFNNLQFENIDMVVFDGAMHHIPEKDFNSVLLQIHKVLNPQGKVLAIFEPFLGSNPLINILRKYQFGRHERRFGVTENIFSKNEWTEMFNKAGFKANFIRHSYQAESNSLKTLIKKMFKGLFPEYIIILEKN